MLASADETPARSLDLFDGNVQLRSIHEAKAKMCDAPVIACVGRFRLVSRAAMNGDRRI